MPSTIVRIPALDMTFPASDPVAVGKPTSTEGTARPTGDLLDKIPHWLRSLHQMENELRSAARKGLVLRKDEASEHLAEARRLLALGGLTATSALKVELGFARVPLRDMVTLVPDVRDRRVGGLVYAWSGFAVMWVIWVSFVIFLSEPRVVMAVWPLPTVDRAGTSAQPLLAVFVNLFLIDIGGATAKLPIEVPALVAVRRGIRPREPPFPLRYQLRLMPVAAW